MARPPQVAEGPARQISAVWGQERIPVLLRPYKEPPLFVRLPYAIDNRAWLQACGRINPKAVRRPKTGKTHWEVPIA